MNLGPERLALGYPIKGLLQWTMQKMTIPMAVNTSSIKVVCRFIAKRGDGDSVL